MQPDSLSTRALFVIGPSALMVGLIWSAIWGDNGMIARQEIVGELRQAHAELAEVERTNQRLLLEVRALDSDPAVLERAVADELHWARPDATVYRFDPLDSSVAAGDPHERR